MIKFFNALIAAAFASILVACSQTAVSEEFEPSPETLAKFEEIVGKARDNDWAELPIGELVGKIGLELLGTPYVGGTLEGDPEQVRVDLTGLDCVTFFENSLDMARIIKKGEYEFQDLIDEIRRTRYIDGKIEDYASRLHYTADWIRQNERNGIVEDISGYFEPQRCRFDVCFMTENPEKYPALVENPDLIKKLGKRESLINGGRFFFIPQYNLELFENQFKTGDIVALRTSINGLDYSHTGMIYVDDEGVPRFLHAKYNKGVTLDSRISEYVKSNRNSIGLTLLRPQEPEAED